MRLGFEVERAGLADAPDFEVLARRCARRAPRRAGTLGIVSSSARRSSSSACKAASRSFTCCAARAVGVHQRADVLAGLLASRDLLGRDVLLALERLDLEDQRAAALVERRKRAENRVGIGAAVRQRRSDEVGVVAKECWVEHGDRILY